MLLQAGSTEGKPSLRNRSEASRSTVTEVTEGQCTPHLSLGTLQSGHHSVEHHEQDTRNKQTHKVVEQKENGGSKLLAYRTLPGSGGGAGVLGASSLRGGYPQPHSTLRAS